MKIICVGRNYSAHIDELQSPRPESPVIFMKPDSAILPSKTPFYLPEFSKNIHHEVELIVKISKPGKFIQQEFANRYYQEIGLGIDFTARDVQNDLIAKGLPWELCKGFDGSAVIGDFVDKEQFTSVQDINFSLKKNGETIQQANSSMMLWKIDELISYVSQFFTLKKGDILFTGTPEGVSAVQSNDKIEGFIDDQKLVSVSIK
ncbi:MAG: fumarylacetoacetate hydrolase family protein [Flavobacteriales bacterium]|nr:fumarylacetoacetate hydrolase family protein [Flavobacteriales bacterium]